MARYFKFRSPADLVAEAARLGETLDVTEDLEPLFQPLEIGGLQAAGRLVVQPMEGCDGTNEGLPDELTYRRYQRFGAGGAPIIWGEATAIAGNARMNPRQLWLNDRTASAIEQMLADCRTAHRERFGGDGPIIGLQLTHSGRFSFQQPLLAVHDPILDPLTRDKSTGRTVDESYPLLSDSELEAIEDQYIVAARLAAKIGVDFVDIKQCHRYLLSELLAAGSRPGPYGGSLENRTRLVRNVVTRIREELPDLVIASRLNACDGIPYRKPAGSKTASEPQPGEPCPHELPLSAAFGTNPADHLREDLAEPLELARLLREWGVSLLNISCGNPYANPHLVRPAEFAPVDGYDAPEHPLIGVLRHLRVARAMQQAVPDVPVVGSGYSWLQDFLPQVAAAQVASGAMNLVGVGRLSLSHPDFAATLREEGRLHRKQICRTFSYCTNLMRAKNHPLGQYPTGCPPFDREIYQPLWQEVQAGYASPPESSEPER